MTDTISPEVLASFGVQASNSVSVSDLARAFIEADRLATEAKQAASKANAEAERLESMLIQKLEEAGMTSMKLADPSLSLSMVPRTDYRLPAEEDREARGRVLRWLSRHGGRDTIKRTVNYQTFSAVCREIKESGGKLHDAIIESSRKYISVRKA